MNEQLINAKNINVFVIFLFLFSFVPFSFSQNDESSEVGMLIEEVKKKRQKRLWS